MQIGFPRETLAAERRAAATPQTVQKLVGLGATVAIEAGLGLPMGTADADYAAKGAQVIANRTELLETSDILGMVREPTSGDLEIARAGTILIGFYDPLFNPRLVHEFAARKLTAISMEFIPRTTRAQKMDALSSQANLAGYVAVILAADHLQKIFPMMTTAAGTIKPSQVFIIGAGVAGLQAIATAHRLGARVEAFDTRPVVKEQVMSLGAKFVEVDLGETGQTAGGYAKELTPEQLALQREAMAKACSLADVVITTAQVFGRKAPVIVTDEIVRQMRPGSVIVDLAVESGGNVDGSVVDQVVDRHGVQVIGLGNLPGRVAVHASQTYAQNVFNLLEEFWNKDTKSFTLNLEDDILQSCVIVHDGEIRNDRVREAVAAQGVSS